jgi:predicted dehydrogenase
MNDSLGVCLVGYGYWSPKLIRNIRAIEGYRLVTVCEKDTSRHEQIKDEQPNVEITLHYRDAFARADVDAVIIATIPSSHFRIAKAALEAGKHVLVEKPLTLSVEEGEILLKEAKSRGLTLMVDHTYLYTPAIQKMRELIGEGKIGSIQSIESIRTNLGIFQRDTNVLWDLAPHDFSILLSLLKERPTHVSAMGMVTVSHPKQSGRHPSTVHIILQYPDEKVFHIHVSWISPIKTRQLLAIGNEGVLLYDQLAQNPLTRFETAVTPNDSETSGALFNYKTSEAIPISISPNTEDLRTMLEDFLSSARAKKTPISNAEIGLETVAILAAAQKSLDSEGKKTLIKYQSSGLKVPFLS